jgi:integrase
MTNRKDGKGYEGTNVTNLLRNRQSGIYYARVRVNGKQKWRSLDTKLPTVAKLRLADVAKELRAEGILQAPENALAGPAETKMGSFITILRQRLADDSKLAPASKSRREIAIKALLKTWPELPTLDARRVTPKACKEWAAKALRIGTGFVAPNAKTVRTGMSPSAFNKCVEVLRALFEIAKENGAAYLNPAAEVDRAKVGPKRFDLPTVGQFHAIVATIADAGARQSKDCADMVRVLAFSGARLQEAAALRWSSVDQTHNRITIPGTKSGSSYRTIPIFPPLIALLVELKKRRGPEPGDAPILRVRECKGALTSACKAVGIKRLTHHDLRHLFATRCIETGVDIPTLSRWLGHSDGGALAMRVYGHLTQEHSQKEATKVSF